jgi:hypothetical protein
MARVITPGLLRALHGNRLFDPEPRSSDLKLGCKSGHRGTPKQGSPKCGPINLFPQAYQTTGSAAWIDVPFPDAETSLAAPAMTATTATKIETSGEGYRQHSVGICHINGCSG